MGKIDRAALRQRIQTLDGLTDEGLASLVEDSSLRIENAKKKAQRRDEEPSEKGVEE